MDRKWSVAQWTAEGKLDLDFFHAVFLRGGLFRAKETYWEVQRVRARCVRCETARVCLIHEAQLGQVDYSLPTETSTLRYLGKNSKSEHNSIVILFI